MHLQIHIPSDCFDEYLYRIVTGDSMKNSDLSLSNLMHDLFKDRIKDVRNMNNNESSYIVEKIHLTTTEGVEILINNLLGINQNK